MIIIVGWVHVNPPDVTEFLADIEVIGPGTRDETGASSMPSPWRTRVLAACS